MTSVQTAAQQASFTATVHAPDAVLFTASSDSQRALTARVVDYIRGRCDDVLWPADASAVHSLIDDGKLEAAIDTYFAHVGKRWDAERLELGGPAAAVPTFRPQLRSQLRP